MSSARTRGAVFGAIAAGIAGVAAVAPVRAQAPGPTRSALAVSGNRALWVAPAAQPGGLAVGTWSPSGFRVVVLAPATDIVPAVALMPNGRGAIVWSKGLTDWRGQRPGSTDRSVPAGSPVVMTRGGDMVVLATGRDGSLSVARRPAGGKLGPFRRVTEHAFKSQATLDVDGAGNAIVAWIAKVNGRLELRARAFTAHGRLLGRQVLSGPKLDARAPTVAFDSAGDAVVAWRSGPAARPSSIEAAVRPAGEQSFRRIRLAGPVAPSALPLTGGPYLTPGTRVSVFWTRRVDQSGRVALTYRTQAAGNLFGPPRDLYRGFASLPPISLPNVVGRSFTNRSGGSVLVWLRADEPLHPASDGGLPKADVVATVGDGNGVFCESDVVATERREHRGLQAGLTDTNRFIVGDETNDRSTAGGGEFFQLYASHTPVIC